MIGKEYKPEKCSYKDVKTGREVIQLTSNESNNYHLYFTDNSFTVGDKEIYFLSDREENKPEIYNFYRMDLSTGLITRITNEKCGINLQLHTKTPESDILVYLVGNKIKKVNTKTGQTDIIYEERPGIDMGAPFISTNKKYIGITRNESVNIIGGPNYTGFKETMYATKKSWVTLVYLDGSQVVDAYEETHWIGHFQFSPDDNTIALYCHEGPWNLVHQRIWILDIVSGTVKPCFRQGEDDCIGHEFWTRDGKIFFDNRKKGHDGTITSNGTQATIKEVETDQSPYVGLADKDGNIIRTIPMPYYCNHYHSNNDNSILVGDEVDDIVLIDIKNDEPALQTLCTHNTSWYAHRTHCHPTFSWGGDKILFTSDREGKCNLYMVDIA